MSQRYVNVSIMKHGIVISESCERPQNQFSIIFYVLERHTLWDAHLTVFLAPGMIGHMF